ncbi:MAG: double zinc ribbon domain-containing protein, partial [Planctomycetaceae bacterium]|nr:double zinc ribbon domain-containing protein [Planctomycetaceae bacterium]
MFLENPLVETIRNGIKDIGSRLLDLICPPVCPFCNTLKPDNEPVCPECAVKLATPAGEYCRRCGGRRYKIFRETMDCERCRTTKFFFDRAIVLGEYEKEIRKL